VNDRLCGGHGVCGSDGDLKAVRCFCNDGFEGADCSLQASGPVGSSHAVSVLVAFVIILVIALLVMAVVLYRKIRRLNADDRSYSALGEDGSARRAAAAPVVSAAPPPAVSGGAVGAEPTGYAAPDAEHAASSKLAAAVAGNV
jgi:hypothetical protein